MALETFTFGAQKRSTRLDEVGALTYVGSALPGSAESAAVWQIMRMDETADPDLTILWADGDNQFDNVWDDRLGLSYS